MALHWSFCSFWFSVTLKSNAWEVGTDFSAEDVKEGIYTFYYLGETWSVTLKDEIRNRVCSLPDEKSFVPRKENLEGG